MLNNNINKRPSLHLHFGAGKIGLGLLLNAIESGCDDYAIIQRPSKSWTRLIQKNVENITVKINGKAVGKPLRFLHGRNWGSKMRPGEGPYFVCAESGKSLLDAVRKARSFSCSLNKGLPGIKAILGRLPVSSNPPKLYACENDHKAVEELAQELDGRLRVVPCMVDRICSSRTIGLDGTVEVKTEPWTGQIVVLPEHETSSSSRVNKPDDDRETTDADESDMPISRGPRSLQFTPSNLSAVSNLSVPSETDSPDEESETKSTVHELPFAGPTVLTTDTEAQAEYFSRRKILLVNGTHTTLAFLTLIKKLDEVKCINKMDLPGNFDLLDYEHADAAQKQMIWAWLVARCYIVTTEFPMDVIKGAHNTDSEAKALRCLLDYAWTTLQRFSHVPDTTGRVLSGGVVRRYNGRLKNVLDTLLLLSREQVGSPEAILRAAEGRNRPEVTVEIINKAVGLLVRRATPIAEEKRKRELDRQEPSSPKQTTLRRWEFLSMLRKTFFGAAAQPQTSRAQKLRVIAPTQKVIVART
ncbi:hypothetical protein AAMO2058_000638100 [Amorphochlora amoebiformis]|eukprot:1347746-Amorphochlora_amoeboformis.AAC.1